VVPEAVLPLTLMLHSNIALGAARNIPLSASEIKKFSLLGGKVVGHCNWYMPVSYGS
jgi:hypothetical protein